MVEELYEMLQDLRPEFDFKDSINYIGDGYLDSFDIIALISDIEERYSVVIDGEEIVPENFENVNKIVELIEKSRG